MLAPTSANLAATGDTSAGASIDQLKTIPSVGFNQLRSVIDSTNAELEIRNGTYVRGQIDKSVLGGGSTSSRYTYC